MSRRILAQVARLAGACTVYFSLVALAQSEAHSAWQIPLTDTEQSIAVTIALAVEESDPDVFQLQESAFSRDVLAARANHPLGVQVLLTELRESKNAQLNSQRQVEVFLFDYDLGVTLLKLVDVERRTTLSTTVIDTAHLPLSDAEIRFARSLIQGHAELQDIVVTELNNSLNDQADYSVNEELQARISVWVPDADTDLDNRCINQRCALVSLFTRDDYSLSVEPVVNLSSSEIYLDLFE